MRTLSLLALCAAPLFSLAQDEKPNFTVTGTLKNFSTTVSKVYLNYVTNGQRITDSSDVTNGNYSFKGIVAEPVRAMLRVKMDNTTPSQRRDASTVFLEPGKIELASTDSFSNIKVSGSKSHIAFEALNNELKPFTDQMNELNTEYRKLYEAKDQEGMGKLQEKANALDKSMKDVYRTYAKKNPTSPLALFAITQFAGYDLDAKELEPYFNALPATVKASPSGKDFANKLDVAMKTDVGNPAMDFTQNDTLGNPVSLSSFKGKYVLVDFWASWCTPCRAENPNVVKAFEAFKDKGFTVLGISLDQPGKKDKWLEAIQIDKLTWTHVSDLQFWNNAVAKQYGIQAIPQNLLVDPNGIIVAKNIRGEELQQKLAELIK